MSKWRRLLASLLSAVMVVSMLPISVLASNFVKSETWNDALFSDVAQNDWFYDSVKGAYELDLMAGTGDGKFNPTGEISLAETVTIAARIHSIHATGEEAFAQGTPWYQVYVDYALANGILSSELADYARAANRLEFARILAKALPAEELKAINTVEDGAIPDLKADEDVYALYRAGILTGTDEKGTFAPNSTITRSEVAAISARMADPALRQTVTLKNKVVGGGGVTGGITTGGSTTGGSTTGGVTTGGSAPSYNTGTDVLDDNNALTVPFDQAYPDLFASGEVNYSGEHILIKMVAEPTGEQQSQLNAAGVTSLEMFMDLGDAKWYKAFAADVTAAMEAVRALSFIDVAEYDFTYETDTIIECKPDDLDENIKGNDKFAEQWYLRACGLKKGWDNVRNPHYRPGYDEDGDESTDDGASDEEVTLVGAGNGIVVAVIDTGVDYEHEDLKDNIWVNTKEIPNNGIDDDGNGYKDDYYGYDAVANKGSGMDDQGHGTHVAGIIAAANNNLGIVGIAYNAKIMPIKAGMASGYFNQSDIAEAILYAYNNYADVINMSFGGSASSIAVQDALEKAYTRCVLVAAAGNDGAPNEETDFYHGADVKPTYPASLTYVLGVTSVGEDGVESSFTNWDVYAYNNPEYEVAAPGEQMISTIPGNRYATWDGTSMAAPVVSAMAALLREEYRDPNTYPTKFIYGQLSSTGEQTAICRDPKGHAVNGRAHNLPKIVDIYNAMTVLPKPEVSVSDYTLFDTAGIRGNAKNNGDGVIDAGETIAIGFELRNRWGKSENTVVTVDTLSQAGIADPYITIHNPSVNYGSVGTYSTQDAGKVKTGDVWTGWENPIYVTVSEDCPNDYIFKLNVKVTCENALDTADNTVYSSEASYSYNVRRGVILPRLIDKDMTLTADDYYIIPNATLIAEGATVTVEPGTQIQFWSDDANDPYADSYIAYLNVEGTLLCNGTAEKPIKMFPSERMSRYRVEINEKGSGYVKLYHTDVVNPYITGVTYAEGCEFTQNYLAMSIVYRVLDNGVVLDRDGYSESRAMISIDTLHNCAFYKLGSAYDLTRGYLKGKHYNCVFVDCSASLYGSYVDCLFYGNNNYLNNTKGYISGLSKSTVMNPSFGSSNTKIYTDSKTGTVYVSLNTSENHSEKSIETCQLFAETLGGTIACINTEEELAFLKSSGIYSEILIGLFCNKETGEIRWADGSEVGDFISYEIGKGIGNQALWNKSTGHIKACYDGIKAIILLEFPAQYVEDISLDNYAVTLDTESSGWQIHATAAPSSVANAMLVYKSMDESVATVSETGFVTPVGVGKTEIRVYAPDMAVYTAMTVSVHNRVSLESIDLGDDFTLNIGETKQLTPVLTPAGTTQQSVVYESSNESVATVSESGLVTACGDGTAVITATNPDTGISGSVTVTGIVPVTAVTAEENIVALPLGKEETVEALGISITPANATDPTLVWASSNPEILEVAADGKILKKQAGNATLRATNELSGLYAEVTVVLSASLAEVATVVEMATNRDSSVFQAVLSDGTLWHWGGTNAVPKKLPYKNVKSATFYGNAKMLVVTKDGVLNVYDSNGKLSNDCIGGTPMTGVKKVIAESWGHSFYILREDGSVYAWGTNSYGNLGTGDTVQYSTAVQTLITDVVDIVAEVYGIFALKKDGTVVAYGLNYINGRTVATDALAIKVDEQLENGNCSIHFADRIEVWRVSDAKAEKTWNALGEASVAGWHNQMYVEDGHVYVMGRDDNRGEAGLNGRTLSSTEFQMLEKPENVTDIFLFIDNTFFQTADGKFYSVGRNDTYQLGNLTMGDSTLAGRIFFGIEADTNPPAMEGSNLVDGTLSEDSLILDFDRAISATSSLVAISMRNSAGEQISLDKKIVLDKLHLTPLTGFVAGDTYTLTILDGKLVSNFGAAGEAITLTFTVANPVEAMLLADEGESEIIVGQTLPNPDFTGERKYWTLELIEEEWLNYRANGINPTFVGNAIINRMDLEDVSKWLRIQGTESSDHTPISIIGNYWGTTSEQLIAAQILDFDDFQTLANLNETPFLTEAPENVWPFAVDAWLETSDGRTDIIGNEEVDFYVTFNRDMDTSIELDVRFGSAYPYADYEVDGEWVNARKWKGTTTLTTLIEAGYQYWSIDNGCAADNPAMTLYKDWGRFPFEIDTSSALAMNLFGTAGDEGVTLEWNQDDFATLMGYNVYRADKDEDAYYQKLNSTIIPVGTETFFDDTVEPGKVYYYTFTVVKTDFTESEPSGKIRILSKDTMSPVMYHTPVYQAYAGTNVGVSATVTDNLQLSAVKLHYRVGSAGEWTAVTMTALNDKYSAVISGDKVTLAGIEYYITASDGVSEVAKGSAETPYVITVQENPGEQMMGDVNGDGRISIVDALRVLRAINGKVILTSEEFARADLDGSKVLTAAEALMILKYANGEIGSLQMN